MSERRGNPGFIVLKINKFAPNPAFHSGLPRRAELYMPQLCIRGSQIRLFGFGFTISIRDSHN